MSGFAPPPYDPTIAAEIVVRFSVEGFHRWPGAPGNRYYLANIHRHLFYLEVTLAVTHDDREVEFHDLLDFCRVEFPGGDMGFMSCEMMARNLLTKIAQRWDGRAICVSVFEDNEVGAMVRYAP